MYKNNQLNKHKTRRVYASYAVGSEPLEIKLVPAEPVRPVQWRVVFSLVGMLSLVMIPLVLFSGAYLYYRTSDQMFPGIASGPVLIGGLTRQQAAAKIDFYWNQQYALSASDGQREWKIKPAVLGLRVDADATAIWAFKVARGGDGPEEMLDIIYNGRWVIDPVVLFSPEAARQGLEQLAPGMAVPARNAAVRLENGQWVGVPAQNGIMIDVGATIQGIAVRPEQTLASGKIALVTKPAMPAIPDPAPLLQGLQSALANPLKIRAYDPISNESTEWAVPVEVFSQWVIVTPEDNETDFSLDSARLAPYLEGWKAQLGPDRTLEPFASPPQLTSLWLSGRPVTVLIRHLASQYTTQPGDTLETIANQVGIPYWMIQQANPDVDLSWVAPGQDLMIPSPNEMLRLPVVLNKHIVISISEQRLWTYENGEARSEAPVSTGIGKSHTMPGIFQVQSHEEDMLLQAEGMHLPYFIGVYEAWPGFMHGIHALPVFSSGWRLPETTLGAPSSYGCITVSADVAKDLFDWAEEGVVVEIRP